MLGFIRGRLVQGPGRPRVRHRERRSGSTSRLKSPSCASNSGPSLRPALKGRFYRYSDIRCEPFPVQKPHAPIWVGGHSRAALRRTARHGNGWHPVGAIAASPLPPQRARAARRRSTPRGLRSQKASRQAHRLPHRPRPPLRNEFDGPSRKVRGDVLLGLDDRRRLLRAGK